LHNKEANKFYTEVDEMKKDKMGAKLTQNCNWNQKIKDHLGELNIDDRRVLAI
jgi:hypothetical protein